MAHSIAQTGARAGLPPGPRGLAAARTGLQLVNDPLDLIGELHERYGDLVYFRAGPERLYLVGSPELSREVLVTQGRRFAKGRGLEKSKVLLGNGLLTSEGETHQRNRRLVQPAFHHDRLPAYAAEMVAAAVSVRDRWTPGAVVPMASEMSALTLDVVTRTLFGAAADIDPVAIGRAVSTFVDAFQRMIGPITSLAYRLPTARRRDLIAAKVLLDRTIAQLVAARRVDGGDTGDLLSMLLMATDGGAALDDAQLRDEAVTIFLAGHETTANALTWSWQLLAEHPPAATALRSELDEVLAGRTPSFGDVEALVYTRAVVSEAMRLYPPAWILGRRAQEDVELGGWTIPTGAMAVVTPWRVHRDERWWAEPLAFSPERWLTGDDPARRFEYFPFGGGSRVCIGEQFAWLEAVLLLATLAQRWSPELTTTQPVGMSPSVTLRPSTPVRMRLVDRRA